MNQLPTPSVSDQDRGTPCNARLAGLVTALTIGVGVMIAAICLIGSYVAGSAPSDEMNEALARTPAPMDIDSLLGSSASGSPLIRQDGHVPLEQLLAPRR